MAKKIKAYGGRRVTASSTTEDNFSSPDSGCSAVVGDSLDYFGSDSDGDEEHNP